MQTIRPTARTAVILAAAVLFAGCLPVVSPLLVVSLHPPFRSGDMITNAALVGTWAPYEANRDPPIDQDVTWTFKSASDGTYALTITSKTGTFRATASLARLGPCLFLDIFPDVSAIESYSGLVVPVHWTFRAWIDHDGLLLVGLSDDWLRARIDAGEVSLSYASVEGAIVLTGTTEELRELFLRYGGDTEAFDRRKNLWTFWLVRQE